MGTDIHGPIIEIGRTYQGREKPDYWRMFAHYNWQDRNYLFFNVLAGVRGDEYNVIPPRGIPDECYSVAKEDEPDRDGAWVGDHSFTWITPEEWERVVIAYRAAVPHEGSGWPVEVQDIDNVDHILKLVKGEKFVRLIFGFDS
jgi:hypothetical protein